MSREEDISQEIFDGIIEEWRDDKYKITEAEFPKLIEYVQRAYYSSDPVVNTFSKRQLISNIDLICRSYLVMLRDGWETSSDYIVSKFISASRGLTAAERRETFTREKLHLGALIQYCDRIGYAKFFMGVVAIGPVLLVSHEYGRSVMNSAEEVLQTIQEMYLSEIGFHIYKDGIPVFVKDVDNYYYRVQLDANFENPNWGDMNTKQIQNFDQWWTHFNSDGNGDNDENVTSKESEEEIVFFRKKNSYTAFKHLRRLLSSVKSELFIVDPYLDADAIAMLEAVDKNAKIRWLYGKVQGDGGAAARTFSEQQGNFDYRKDKDMHDRYLFCDGQGYLLGGSLNQFGNKPMTLISLGSKQIVGKIKQYYEGLWVEAGN